MQIQNQVKKRGKSHLRCNVSKKNLHNNYQAQDTDSTPQLMKYLLCHLVVHKTGH